MKYRKKPVVIEAKGPLIESQIVTTAHGRVRAEPGDYVLVDPATGDTWPIKPDIFAATYEAASEPVSGAEELLRELVACKDLETAIDNEEVWSAWSPTPRQLEYNRRYPSAMAAARAYLGAGR